MTTTLEPAVAARDSGSARVPAPRVGDVVHAEDGALGIVDGVIASDAASPAFLVVSAGRRLRRKYPVVPSNLVQAVDRSRSRVYLRGQKRSLVQVSEALPIVL